MIRIDRNVYTNATDTHSTNDPYHIYEQNMFMHDPYHTIYITYVMVIHITHR